MKNTQKNLPLFDIKAVKLQCVGKHVHPHGSPCFITHVSAHMKD